MVDAINPVSIFLPMLVVVALTFVAIVRMAAARGEAVKAGQDPAFYRAHLGTPEPERTVVAVRHYGNLLELPVLFYAVCVTAFAIGGVSYWTLGFAWAYVAARVAQSIVHMSYNRPAHRGLAYIVGALFLFLLWGNLALAIVARL